MVIKGKLEDSTFTIVNIYAPNVDHCLRQFFENLQGHLLESGIRDKDNIIIGGDFNWSLNPCLDKQGGILVPQANVVSAIEGLQTTFNLHDIWRIKNLDVKSYTWSQKSPFVFCRLDFWLTSAHLFDHINSEDICPAIKTDHLAIIIKFKVIEEQLKGSRFKNENIPKLSDKFKEICEGRVRIEEITEVLKSFKDNKVPGIDGLPGEFYKAFWHLLGETLVDSLNAAFDSGRLFISQRQAIITLIDKKR